MPNGFTAELVVAGITSPRAMRVAPNGDLFVADSKTNTIRVFRIPDGSSKPTEDSVFASGLHQPYGIAFYPPGPNPEWVYVANSDSLVRFPYKNGDLKATGKPERCSSTSRRRTTGRVTSSFPPTANSCSSRSVRAPTSLSTWASNRSADWTSS